MSISSASSHVEVVIELLQAEPDASYSISGRPQIKSFQDDAASERGPGAGQPPVIYVHSPTGSTLERHSMDDQQFNKGNTARVQIFGLTETAVIDLQADVVRILSQFLQDNRQATPFNDLAPTQASDFREQKQARLTDHFVTQVTVETTNLTDTGLAN
jgi:hypothetical protein